MSLKAGYKGFKTLGNGLEYNNQTGHLFLKGESDITLDNLKDVDITQPLDGDILVYDSTTGVWYNEQIDSDPVEDSAKPVSSGGVYDAVASRVDWDSYAKTGVHQLMPVTLTKLKSYNTSGTWNNNVYTVNNTDFTCIETSGYVTQVEVAGTPSADIYFKLFGETLKKGSYKWSGCPSGGASNTYSTFCRTSDTTTAEFGYDTGNGGAFTIAQDKLINYYIKIGTSASAIEYTFNPLIKYAEDTSDAVTPYAMTNLELTDAVIKNGYNGTGLTFTNCSLVAGGYVKIGNLCVVNMRVLSDSSGNSMQISGFPAYTNKTTSNKVIVICNVLNTSQDSDVNYYSQINSLGGCTIKGSSGIVPEKEYSISATYLCD